jgi:V/A-type H+-transporting ATPase subunit I
MIFTSQMIQLFAIVLGKDSQRVTETLLREGVLQFINISEIDGEKIDRLSKSEPEIDLSEISDLRRRIEGFLHTGGIIPSAPQETDLNNRVSIEIEKEKRHLDIITSKRESLREKQRVIQQEILKLEDINRQVKLYGTGISDIQLSQKHSFISMQTGKISTLNIKQLEDDLKDIPSLNIELGVEQDEAHYLLISMKRDSEQINKILSKSGWNNVELPDELQSVKDGVFKELSGKLKKLNDEQKKLEKKANDLVKREEQYLKDVWINLRINELFHIVQANYKASSRTVIFSGWLPLSKKEKLTKAIKRAAENRCYLEWNEAEIKDTISDEIPVQFRNPKILEPFQMLVKNFGVPRYGTIDPTPFVMPIYLSMFGLMFADVGQGLVLALLGILGVRYLKNNDEKRGLHKLSWLIIWCGLSSVLFGILFGSFFGISFKPLWFDFHGIISGHSSGNSLIKDIYDILSITLYFGILVIALGLIFNWINIIRTGKWIELIFDKGGFFGGWIYIGGIYIAYYMVSHDYKAFPSGNIIFLLVGLPSLLIFIKEPYHYFKHEADRSDKSLNIFTILTFFMQWIVELLEIFSGYLSNTLSFMRVAGLGIAHVCLMISFFTLAEMTSGMMSILILVLGNILVIGLEGLSAGIQALRLNYYEFFTKFFHGTGKLYTPISLGYSFN